MLLLVVLLFVVIRGQFEGRSERYFVLVESGNIGFHCCQFPHAGVDETPLVLQRLEEDTDSQAVVSPSSPLYGQSVFVLFFLLHSFSHIK